MKGIVDMVTQKAVIWGQGNSEIFSMLSIIFTNAVDTTSSAASSDFTILKEMRWKWTRCSWNIRSTSARCSSFKTPNRSIIIIGSSWVIRCSLSLSGRKTHLHKCFSHGTIFQIIPQNNPTEKRGKRAKPMTPPPFFRGVSGVRTNGKQGKCSHTCYFCIPAGCKNACWGASPNPALGHFVPK